MRRDRYADIRKWFKSRTYDIKVGTSDFIWDLKGVMRSVKNCVAIVLTDSPHICGIFKSWNNIGYGEVVSSMRKQFMRNQRMIMYYTQYVNIIKGRR